MADSLRLGAVLFPLWEMGGLVARSSQAGFHGELQTTSGSTPTWAMGPYGSELLFDNSDQRRIVFPTTLIGDSKQWSVGVVFKNTIGAATGGTLFSENNTGGINAFIALRVSRTAAGNLALFVRGNDGVGATIEVDVGVDDAEYHVVVGREQSATSRDLWYDGRLLGTDSSTQGSRSNHNQMRIGGWIDSGGVGEHFEGSIVAVVVWPKRYLTDAEIVQFAQNPFAILQPDVPLTAGKAPTGALLVTPGIGAATWAGLAPTTLTPRTVTPGVGAGTWAGLAPSALTPRTVTPGVGAGAWAGLAPTVSVTANVTVTPGVGEATWAGLAPTAETPRTVTPGVGAASWAGLAPTAQTPRTATPGVGAATWSGLAPTAQTPRTVTPAVGSATWAGLAPLVITPRTVTPGTGAATWTGLAPTVEANAGLTLTPGTGAGAWAGLAPTVSVTAHVTVTPGVGAASWSGFAPTIHTPRTMTPGVGAGVWAGLAPTVEANAGVSPSPGTGAGVWAGLAPTVSVTAHVTVVPGPGAAIWAGLLPTVTVTANQTVTPGTGEATWAGLSPDVIASAFRRIVGLARSGARHGAIVLSESREVATTESGGRITGTNPESGG